MPKQLQDEHTRLKAELLAEIEARRRQQSQGVDQIKPEQGRVPDREHTTSGGIMPNDDKLLLAKTQLRAPTAARLVACIL